MSDDTPHLYGTHRVKVEVSKEPGYRIVPRFRALTILPKAILERLPSVLTKWDFGLATEGNGFRPIHSVWSGEMGEEQIIALSPFWQNQAARAVYSPFYASSDAVLASVPDERDAMRGG